MIMKMNFHRSTFARLAILSLSFAATFPSQAGERANRVSVINVSISGQASKARVGADGAIHLLVDSDDGPRYLKSQDGGLSFSSPMAVVNAAAQKPGLKFHA